VALGFELKGELRKDLLQQAFQAVWSASDLPTFRFDLEKGEQWREAESLPIRFESASAREGEVKALFTADFEAPFDLRREAPLRIRLLETKPGKAVLGIVAHHLALDGWSLARLLEKGCDAYNALLAGKPVPALPWQSYWGYMDEHSRQLAHEGTGRSLEFWKGRELRAAPLLAQDGGATAGHRVIYILNRKYYQKVKELAKGQRVTPFLFLLACFTRALGKVLGRKDFLLSVPIAARDWDQAEFVIGNCVNLMPMEVRLTDDPAGDLQAIRSQYLDTISHSLVPAQTIQSFHHSDLTQLHFNFEPSVEEPKLEGLEIDFYPFPVNQVERPVIINVNDTKKTYYIEIDFQFQALDLIKALTVFTETERAINKFGGTPAPADRK
jgi:hypothetical protein